MGVKCICAQTAYRNNLDGTRDYKIVGKSSCQICRGSGWVKVCVDCEGAGLFNSKPCYTCHGNGKVRVEA